MKVNSVNSIEIEINKKKKEIEKLKKQLSSVPVYKDILIQQEQKEIEQRNKTFNGLSAREWTINSRSVWNDVSSSRQKKHLDHGATFPKKLAERIIKMYSKKNDLVFDPFLGTGTTVVSALENKRKGIGIELNPKFCEFARMELGMFGKSKIIEGDALKEINNLTNNSIQLTFTSPPYADLIHKVVKDRANTHKKSKIVLDNNSTAKLYSNSEKDFGNMSFNKYCLNVLKLMKKIYKKTKNYGYNIWVVKDYRDTKNGIPYVDLHGAIAKIGQEAGFKYHDLIIWDQNEQRSLVLLGYPSVFYVNQNNSFLVVLRKNE